MMIENQNKTGWKKDFQSKLNYIIPILFFPLLAFFASTFSIPVARKAGPEVGVAAEKIIPRSSASSRGSQSLTTSLGQRVDCYNRGGFFYSKKMVPTARYSKGIRREISTL